MKTVALSYLSAGQTLHFGRLSTSTVIVQFDESIDDIIIKIDDQLRPDFTYLRPRL